MRKIIPALLLLLASSASAAPPDYSNIGPMPEREAGIAMVQDAVMATLKDPDSAKFVWPNPFVMGWYRIPFGSKYVGWITCGTVNAKNGYGGYAGALAVVGIISGGRVLMTEIDTPNIYGNGEGSTADFCHKMGIPPQG